MAAMAVAEVDGLGVVGERLEVFAAEVLAEAMNRPVQMVNGGLVFAGIVGGGAA